MQNTFDLHKAIIGLENHFCFFLRVAVSDRLTVVIKLRIKRIAHLPICRKQCPFLILLKCMFLKK